tara:strand:- start:2922 stop:3125 length:204 start_codon:yes stop_codon:yes gene_type:complete
MGYKSLRKVAAAWGWGRGRGREGGGEGRAYDAWEYCFRRFAQADPLVSLRQRKGHAHEMIIPVDQVA